MNIIKALLIVSAFVPFSEAAEVLDLETVSKIVLEKNAAAAGSKAGVREAEGNLSAAKAGYAPSVAFGGSWTRGNNPVHAFGTLLTQSRFEAGDFDLDKLNHPSALDNFQGQVGLVMPILDWQRSSRVDSARAFRQISEENRKEVGQRLLMDTVESFYGLVLAKEQKKILEDRIRESEEELKEALALKDQGLVLGSDFHMGSVLLGQMRQQLIQVRSQIVQVRSALEELMGNGESGEFEISGVLEKPGAADADLKILVQETADHPLVRISRHSVQSARAELRSAQRDLWPTLSGFSTVEGDGDRFDRGGWNYTAGLRLHMPLFDPSDRAREAARRAALERTEADQRVLGNRIHYELKDRLEDYRALKERLPEVRATLAEAENALRMFRKLYKNGRQSIADVMQGEMALAQSRSALNQTLHDLRVAHARVLFAAGRLDSVPEELK